MSNKKLANIIVGLLAVQFALGMLANLYATIPEHRPYEVFARFGFIMLHVLVAVALIVLGVILALKSRGHAEFRRAAVGLLHLGMAFVFGELFVFTQQDIFSLLMALAFLGAFIPYARLAFTNPTPENRHADK